MLLKNPITVFCKQANILATAGFVSLLMLMGPIASSFGQNPEQKLGNWIGATSSMRYANNWSLFLQGELRTWEMVSNLNEVLWRAAIHYDFNKKLNGAIGYVRVDTWPYTNEPYRKFYENRIFQEFLIKSKWGNDKCKKQIPDGATLDYNGGIRNRV